MDTLTCIVALKQGEKVFIGGDSAGTNSFSLKSTLRKDPKVFIKKDANENEWLFGFTSSFRMGQLIQHVFNIPPIDVNDQKDLFAYMVKKFIPALQRCLREGGYEGKREERLFAGTFIVAIKGEIFKIHDDYQVATSLQNFCAAGCGEDLALGALWATKNEEDPQKRVQVALEAAEAFSAGVRSPFTILSV
jgi:ATP-dependent protease HslVU (ClpYQ) peptidase subunit